MGFFTDLLFGKKTGVDPAVQSYMSEIMGYRPSSVMTPDVMKWMQGGPGMSYLEESLSADPFSSKAWEQTKGAMMNVLGENLQGLSSQLGASGMLRGSGAERYGARVTSDVMNQLGTQALGAGLQSEGMRQQAAMFLPQMNLAFGQGIAGLYQQDISNMLNTYGLGMQAAMGQEGMRRTGQERSGGLLGFATDLFGTFAGAGGIPGIMDLFKIKNLTPSSQMEV